MRFFCNDYPEMFKTIETSYGYALELVSWDPDLVNPLPMASSANLLPMASSNRDLIVDKPLKFKQLRLRKGLNVKRKHKEFLIKFGLFRLLLPLLLVKVNQCHWRGIVSEWAFGFYGELIEMRYNK
ncbi:hypothetical protein IFM89_031585 [Coptis chinensis]|uniref:PORR domain-containing protein n=1 Tax=Coptis chinensis TaxID=261450 RepID=A0A835HWM2_9MAGN|nr:hypothetical protein IFM89_031585 [Coptis chinensis]